MTVITRRQARAWAEHIYDRPITDQELEAIVAAEHAGNKIEGYIGFVAACHMCKAYAHAIADAP